MGWLTAGFLGIGLLWVAARLVEVTRGRDELLSRIGQSGSGPWWRDDQDFPGCKW